MDNKIALVTGGTAGVGRSIVGGLVERGAFVHFIGTNEEKGRQVEAALNGSGEPRCRFIRLDLSRLGDVGEFARRFAEEVPTLDVLANVAGVVLPTHQVTDEGIEKTLAVDHLAAYVLSRDLAPALARARRGRIVNVSGTPGWLLDRRLDFDRLDAAGLQSPKGYNMFGAALDAVHAKTVMTEILADRLVSEGIDVNAFHPGAVRSDLTRELRFPLNLAVGVARRFMSPVSKTGVYVSTADELDGVTGQLFVNCKPRKLHFEPAYKDRLRTWTEDLLGGWAVVGA